MSQTNDGVNRLDIIRKNYTTPGHPTAYAGITAVQNYYNGQFSRSEVESVLHSLDAYTRHREYKQPAYYNPYYVYKQRQEIQADLIDVRAHSQKNDGYNYLLLLIDLFSRKIWVYPTKTKQGVEIRNILEEWLNNLGDNRKPKQFNSDAGKEFKNGTVSRMMQAKNIRQTFASGTSKAAYAERANKTFQILLNKYMTDVQSLRYIDVLPDLVTSYNTRPHRSLDGMTPEEADRPEEQQHVRGILTKNHAMRALSARKKAKLQVGDMVRVKYLPKKLGGAARAYNPQFSGEYFEIVDVNTRMMVPMYKIRSMNTGEEISDRFYSNELQKVRGDVFKVEKILRTRGRGLNKEVLVKWQFFDDHHNSWEPERNIIATYNNTGGTTAAAAAAST